MITDSLHFETATEVNIIDTDKPAQINCMVSVIYVGAELLNHSNPARFRINTLKLDCSMLFDTPFIELWFMCIIVVIYVSRQSMTDMLKTVCIKVFICVLLNVVMRLVMICEYSSTSPGYILVLVLMIRM